MSLVVEKLRTEYVENPLGLDTLTPRLSWQLASPLSGQLQSAYRVIAATSEEKLQREVGDLWDSGRIESDQSIHIAYEGSALQSGQLVFWKVMVWNQNDVPSRWSRTAKWSMGLLKEEDWQAKWIGRKKPEGKDLLPAVYLRKEFHTGSKLRRATAYVSALGLYYLYINGNRVSEDLFAPGWTDYAARVQYQAYDVTHWLDEGGTTIGAILGTGWYCGNVGQLGTERYGDNPYLLAQLHLEYEDGSEQIVSTDQSWKVSEGPILYSDIIMGEAYDARLEQNGWNAAGFTDQAWEQAVVFDSYEGRLSAQVDPPIRITEQLLPVSISKIADETYIFDMAQNMVGWVELKVRGEKGSQIKVRHAEMLNPDGTMYIENLRLARPEEYYFLKGEGVEVFEPHFTFHGFRFVEVSGLKETPTLEMVVGKVIHNANPDAGVIETSDPMINKLIKNISWGQRGNFLSVPTDCPQRNERLGWTGDAQIFARTACYLTDAARFFTKYTIDMNDAQHPNGAFTDVAPDGGYYKLRTTRKVNQWLAPDNAAWADAGVIIPWTLYQVYGDRDILSMSYEPMVRWIDYCVEKSDHLVRPGYSDYGDWLSINADTPKDVLATAYFAYSTKLMSQISEVLGRNEDAQKYAQLFKDICLAFQGAFVDPDGRIKGHTQTVYVLALQFRLLDEQQREQAIRHLTADIREKGDHLTTGFLGVGYLLPSLSESGQADIAYKLLHQDSFPSWLYSVKHGATTIWERWDGWTDHKGFQTPSMNSFNHYSLGSVGEWMFRYMAGIDTDPLRPAFKHVIIEPTPGGHLNFVNGSYESMYGTIRSEWKVEGRKFTLHVEIPANTTATVWLPGKGAACDELEASLVTATGKSAGKQGFEVQSGHYHFTSWL